MNEEESMSNPGSVKSEEKSDEVDDKSDKSDEVDKSDKSDEVDKSEVETVKSEGQWSNTYSEDLLDCTFEQQNILIL